MKNLMYIRLLQSAVLSCMVSACLPVWAFDTKALPGEPQVREALESLPEVKAARATINLEMAGRKRLEAGPYEWTVKAGQQQRRDNFTQSRYSEQELAIEKQARWFGKQGKDVAIGDQAVMRAEAGLGDAWHESAKLLLQSWFDWQKEFATVQTLNKQLQLLSQQTQATQKRFKAGDAAKTELLLAGAEQQRVTGLLRLAQSRADHLRIEIERRFPGVLVSGLEPIPEPEPLNQTTDSWVALILKHNHELEMLEAETNRARLLTERSRLDAVPDPVFGIRAAQERDRQEKLLGVTLAIAIPGDLRKASAAQALAAQNATEENARKNMTRIEREAYKTVTAAQAAFGNYEQLKLTDEQFQETARLLSRAYTLGEAPLSDTLIARRQALEARLAADTAQLDALYTYYRVMLDAHELWALAEHDEK